MSSQRGRNSKRTIHQDFVSNQGGQCLSCITFENCVHTDSGKNNASVYNSNKTLLVVVFFGDSEGFGSSRGYPTESARSMPPRALGSVGPASLDRGTDCRAKHTEYVICHSVCPHLLSIAFTVALQLPKPANILQVACWPSNPTRAYTTPGATYSRP